MTRFMTVPVFENGSRVPQRREHPVDVGPIGSSCAQNVKLPLTMPLPRCTESGEKPAQLMVLNVRASSLGVRAYAIASWGLTAQPRRSGVLKAQMRRKSCFQERWNPAKDVERIAAFVGLSPRLPVSVPDPEVDVRVYLT